MGNKNTHDQKLTNKRARFVVSKHANDDVADMNEEEYYSLKLEELAIKKLSLFAYEENDVLCEQIKEKKKSKKLTKFKGGTKRKRSSRNEDGKKNKVKRVVDREIVCNEVITRLKEFVGEIKGCDMKLVIQKTLFESDLKRSQNRLNMPFNQVETHDFLTGEEIRLGSNTDKAGIEVRLVGPNMQMFKKPMWLKIWNMKSSKNYVLKTNWCDFVEANKKVLKERATIQVWSFRKDGQLCFAVVCVDEPVVNRTTLEDASSVGGSLLI
ncbi:B3 domain-containing protein, DNA-binding pseudobarrel domain protein [Artemisia annua]|uniref:B3 domain-containing protein, DNA-binding pseudobarrel domain protein n=1 Tax=Artemisia annua TaxID=35608 RepID=A0A2U1MMQ8_ARTAN|nr:B3 domain-containing protein, DNA-binding pseudobarrel domain protein [Artemisia annua]